MARARGGAAARRYIEQLPGSLAERVLPGAVRAGAAIIAQEAKDRLGPTRVSVAETVKIRLRNRDGRIIARILLDGPGAYVGRWLEYGTDPHFISVDPGYAQGMTARRVNTRITEGDADLKASLFINGKAVGTTVHHPGAKAYPFLRPALDTKRAEAVTAAQAYINSRVKRGRIVGGDGSDDE